MTALLVVLLVVAFLVIDLLVRMTGRRIAAARERRAREEALETNIRLDFTHEAKSLKRVEVPHAQARILAVDDEPVVLDSFRKILVLAGFDVDTVESGPEALGLVQRNDYDFVFTDLKMPDMDGVEVVKAVHHLRPDIDIAVITGYGTIESAVETMQHGAIDYVQKPFTEEELIQFARRLLIRRKARIESARKPTVKITTPVEAETEEEHDYCIPGGAFVSDGHAWARIEPGGQVRIGLDDFARKALGEVETSECLVDPGDTVRRGDPLFAIGRGRQQARFASPFSGRLLRVNTAAIEDPMRITRSPYDQGWICLLQPSDLKGEIPLLRIGRPVADWYQEEIARLREMTPAGGLPLEDWGEFSHRFLGAAVGAGA